MNQVVAADSEQIAVTGIDHDIQFGIGQLQPGCERNRPPVRSVERIQLHVAGNASGAADARHDGDVLQVHVGFGQRAGERVDASTDAASRTPDVRHALGAQKRFHRIDRYGRCRHRATSMMAWRISSGRCTLPPACPTKRTAALPATARSTSRTICPKFSSATTKAFTFEAISAIFFSGNGQAVMRRNLPTFTPLSRARSIARCATREVMPYETTTTSAPSIWSSS